LLIDDDPGVLDILERFFTWDSWRVFRSPSGSAGLSTYQAERPDLVVLDISMPGMNGLDVLQALVPQGATVIMLTGQADLEIAVEAMQIGAENFLPKPVNLMHLAASAERAMEKVNLRRANYTLANRLAGERSPDSLGTSPRMRELARQVELLSSSDATTVLLLGESGTGKSWVAQMLHARSPRSRGAMVEVNCAGLSATFLDSELFGHERGAFTDAKTAKRGLLEVADRGTLFLDEVGDMPGDIQPKLLKVLESKTFRRLGGTQEIHSDARLVAATNKDLSAETKAGRFREDLYYRLSVFPLVIPPLRERSPDDIVELIGGLLRDAAPRHPRSPSRLSPKVLDRLLTYSWPGNVRELRNVLERALVLAGGSDEIRPEHLPITLNGRRTGNTVAPRGTPELLPLAEVERRHIEHTLAALEGNRTLAAKTLGISRATLHSKIRQLGLEEVGRA
jgi:DNA-binding NtrC family response regulator